MNPAMSGIALCSVHHLKFKMTYNQNICIFNQLVPTHSRGINYNFEAEGHGFVVGWRIHKITNLDVARN